MRLYTLTDALIASRGGRVRRIDCDLFASFDYSTGAEVFYKIDGVVSYGTPHAALQLSEVKPSPDEFDKELWIPVSTMKPAGFEYIQKVRKILRRIELSEASFGRVAHQIDVIDALYKGYDTKPKVRESLIVKLEIIESMKEDEMDELELVVDDYARVNW